jgi:hypothetical protein
MRVEGDADELYQELFPHGLVSQIIQLLVDTWRLFERPKDDEDEPKITNRFAGALQNEGRRRRSRFRIMPHVKDVARLDPQTGRGFVEIDIYVPHGYDSRCFFGIEAKKLNTTSATGKWQSQAGDYAGEQGMGCFVDGCYASHQCEGAMVGYVMDGDCVKAKSSVSEAIDKRAIALRVPMPCPLHPSKGITGYPYAFETRHDLERGEFAIYHLLLAA